MKICLITPNVFPVPATKGGACETLVNNIIDKNEKERKVEITCISIFEEEAYERSKKYTATKFIYIKENESETKDVTFKTKDDSIIGYMDCIYNEIKNEYFDFIIIEGGDLRAYNYLLNRFPKEKCIAHVHGNYIGDEVMNNTYQYFLTVSDFIANKLKSSGIIEENRVKRIYNGIKIENFDKHILEREKNSIRHKYGIKDDEQLVVFCGRTVKKKGIKELICAFKNIRNIDRTKLMIVGNSNFAEEIETEYDKELVEEARKIIDKVVFSGFIPNEKLYEIYNIADLAVFPTIGEEAFGLVIVEAMAGGCPIIVTKSGAFPEIVEGTSIILVNKDERLVDELTSSIDYLLENSDIRRKISMEGKERAREFSNENYYEDFINILYEFKKNDKGGKNANM